MSAREHLRMVIERVVTAMEEYMTKTYNQYRARLWGAAQRLFTGGREGNFMGTFARAIDQQLTEAWYTGAEKVGFSKDDITNADMQPLEKIINDEIDFMEGMAADILAAREAGMKPEDFESQFGNRVDMWANRYNDTVNAAVVYFGGKTKLEWVLGPTETHCEHNERPGGWGCANLAGTVATAEEWEKAEVKPQGEMLSCNGFHCQCSLVPTDKPITPGGIPRP